MRQVQGVLETDEQLKMRVLQWVVDTARKTSKTITISDAKSKKFAIISEIKLINVFEALTDEGSLSVDGNRVRHFSPTTAGMAKVAPSPSPADLIGNFGLMKSIETNENQIYNRETSGDTAVPSQKKKRKREATQTPTIDHNNPSGSSSNKQSSSPSRIPCTAEQRLVLLELRRIRQGKGYLDVDEFYQHLAERNSSLTSEIVNGILKELEPDIGYHINAGRGLIFVTRVPHLLARRK